MTAREQVNQQAQTIASGCHSIGNTCNAILQAENAGEVQAEAAQLREDAETLLAQARHLESLANRI